MIQGIRATSKSSLKLQCLFAAKGDLKEAKELYDFFAADMPNLPDYDPVQPSWVDNTRDAFNGILGWFRENQDTLAQGYDFIRSIVTKAPGTSAGESIGELPPINDLTD